MKRSEALRGLSHQHHRGLFAALQLKRARKETAEGRGATADELADGTVVAVFPDGATTRLAAGTPLKAASCTCGAATMCRHRVGLVLAYQQRFGGVADSRALAFGIQDNLESHVGIGGAVHVNVAIALVVLEDRHRRLLGHGDQRRFGHHRRETDGEAEQHQERHRAAAGELVGQALAHREDAEFEALQEERHPQGDDQQARRHAQAALGPLAQQQCLERDHHDDDRQQVAQGVEKGVGKVPELLGQVRLPG